MILSGGQIFKSCVSDKFNKALQIYNNALKASGFSGGLQYLRSDNQADRRPRNRPRSIIWFNPSYRVYVQSNAARFFHCLINKHFPKSHVLPKILKRNNVKVSNSCMSNKASLIKSHNSKLLGKDDTTTASKCTKKYRCPLNSAFLVNNII